MANMIIGEVQKFYIEGVPEYHIAYAYVTKEGGVSRYYIKSDTKAGAILIKNLVVKILNAKWKELKKKSRKD